MSYLELRCVGSFVVFRFILTGFRIATIFAHFKLMGNIPSLQDVGEKLCQSNPTEATALY